jgi:peptidylprolyl isomerase
MKLSLSKFLIVGAALLATAGCGNHDSATADSAAGPSVAGPSQPVASSAPVAGIPETTTVNGKSVKLTTTASGLKYVDLKVGSGANPKVGQTVSVQYTGTLLDGTKFDSSYDHGGAPIDFPIGVGQVIKGWDEGVPTMKVGGKRRLYIPSELAYGANPPTPAIPPNSPLVFDIELVGVK